MSDIGFLLKQRSVIKTKNKKKVVKELCESNGIAIELRHPPYYFQFLLNTLFRGYGLQMKH